MAGGGGQDWDSPRVGLHAVPYMAYGRILMGVIRYVNGLGPYRIAEIQDHRRYGTAVKGSSTLTGGSSLDPGQTSYCCSSRSPQTLTISTWTHPTAQKQAP